MDFIIARISEFFNMLDGAVVIDSPRFSLFTFFVSVVFTGLLIRTMLWLAGKHQSGGSRWDYITHNITRIKEKESVWKKNKEEIELAQHLEHLRRY
jgi:hypothetical protein